VFHSADLKIRIFEDMKFKILSFCKGLKVKVVFNGFVKTEDVIKIQISLSLVFLHEGQNLIAAVNSCSYKF
jgi:hypothetical protein